MKIEFDASDVKVLVKSICTTCDGKGITTTKQRKSKNNPTGNPIDKKCWYCFGRKYETVERNLEDIIQALVEHTKLDMSDIE